MSAREFDQMDFNRAIQADIKMLRDNQRIDRVMILISATVSIFLSVALIVIGLWRLK